MTGQEEKKEEILTYPEGYEVPKKWEPKVLGGKIGGMNRPTAGKRFESTLPKGKHGIQLYSLGTPNGQKVPLQPLRPLRPGLDTITSITPVLGAFKM